MFSEWSRLMVIVLFSGMFRPEMLRPMGLPENVRVIAWGLSLERPTMILYGYKTIKEGDAVAFDIIQGEKGRPQADRVNRSGAQNNALSGSLASSG